MEFIETPLAQIADFLSHQHAVKFVLAPKVEGNEAISVNARGRLSDLLNKVLRRLDLEYRVQQDAVLITPIDEAVYLNRLRDSAEAERLYQQVERSTRELEQHARRMLEGSGVTFGQDRLGWITTARLSGPIVSNSRIEAIQHLRHLTRLDLAGTTLTNDTLALLNGLDQLEMLQLGGTTISDTGLASLKVLPRLRVLDLSSTQITDVGLLELADFPSLMGVVVAGTRITPVGIAGFRQIASRVQVLTERPTCQSRTSPPAADPVVPASK